MYARWYSHKSGINNCSTSLAAHFSSGCPGDTGRGKENLGVTLLDYLSVTGKRWEQLDMAG